MSNLLKEILDRIEFEQLIFEGRDPVEVLHYKYKNVPENIIDYVIKIDPTKKKSYSQWLLSKWDDESDIIYNNLKNGRIERLFQHYKEHNDIQIKDCPSVSEGLAMYVPDEDTVLTKSDKPTTTLMNDRWKKEVDSELANDFDIVFNDDNWIIAVPNTYEADCKLGENMFWCTAGGRSNFEDGRSYYNRYLRDYGGKYYVNFDMSQGESRLGKDYPFTRYQFHFESHQFMDKNDDPVELSEIGIPDSAIEFYKSEGYDEDDFENEEERMERYDENRNQWYYQLNDELYLCIEYNDNYEYEEPDEFTPFYVFSEDDWRDPISWEEVSNPFQNSVVQSSGDDFVILEAMHSGILFVYSDEGYWNTEKADSFLNINELGGTLILMGNISGGSTYAWICNGIRKDITLDKVQRDWFINKDITQQYNTIGGEGCFIETYDGEYHSLLFVSKEGIKVFIKNDLPAEGNYFTVSEDGTIKGQIHYYRIFEDSYYDDNEEYAHYQIEDKLKDGNYLISREFDDSGDEEYNILDKNTNKPILNDWFDSFYGYCMNSYVVKYTRDDKYGHVIVTNDGQQIGQTYDLVKGISRLGYLQGDKNGKSDIISIPKRKVIASFDKIVQSDINSNLVLVADGTKYANRCFDMENEKFYYPNAEMFAPIGPTSTILVKLNNGNNFILDLKTNQKLTDNVESISKLLTYGESLFRVSKNNGQVNVIDIYQPKLIFPQDVDSLDKITSWTWLYSLNNRYYMYSLVVNDNIFNSSGFDIKPIINNREITFIENGVRIFFDRNNPERLFGWNDENTGQQGYDIKNMPNNVLELYNKITGKHIQSSAEQPVNANAVAENFKRMLKKINEIRKLGLSEVYE